MIADAVSPPVVLTIAGSDCSAGAGLQADLKTFSFFNVYGLTVVTAVVAEVPGEVVRIDPVSLENIVASLKVLKAKMPIHAIKCGMLYSSEIVRAVADWYEEPWEENVRPPLVVDPVLIATSGQSLTKSDTLPAYAERLLSLATVSTPNLDEATAFLDRKISNADDQNAAAQAWAERWGTPVLLKGGHLRGLQARDVLQLTDGNRYEFSAPFIHGVSTHGTGCTMSAAIAAGLATELPLHEAIEHAKSYVSHAIQGICRWGEIDSLNHCDFMR
jgi:hydroxymethylpyrimidine/phosphomethylpyrimidine kinase